MDSALPVWPQSAFAQISFFLAVLPIDYSLFHSEWQVHSLNVLLQLIRTEPKHSIDLNCEIQNTLEFYWRHFFLSFQKLQKEHTDSH